MNNNHAIYAFRFFISIALQLGFCVSRLSFCFLSFIQIEYQSCVCLGAVWLFNNNVELSKH